MSADNMCEKQKVGGDDLNIWEMATIFGRNIKNILIQQNTYELS